MNTQPLAYDDRWNEFLKFLQYEVWLDYELVWPAPQKLIQAV